MGSIEHLAPHPPPLTVSQTANLQLPLQTLVGAIAELVGLPTYEIADDGPPSERPTRRERRNTQPAKAFVHPTDYTECMDAIRARLDATLTVEGELKGARSSAFGQMQKTIESCRRKVSALPSQQPFDGVTAYVRALDQFNASLKRKVQSGGEVDVTVVREINGDMKRKLADLTEAEKRFRTSLDATSARIDTAIVSLMGERTLADVCSIFGNGAGRSLSATVRDALLLMGRSGHATAHAGLAALTFGVGEVLEI
jgi:hypothetical protein